MENLLMTVDDIKSITSISDNVDVESLRNYIKNATVMYIQPILGIALLDDILLLTSTGNSKYDVLLKEYIYYALAYYAWYNASIFLHVKTQKKGLVKQHSDDSENISLDEFGVYSKRIESIAVTYSNRLRDYLDVNANEFALYRQNNKSVAGNSNTCSSIFLKFKSR